MWFYFRSMEVYLKTMMIFLHLLKDDIHAEKIRRKNVYFMDGEKGLLRFHGHACLYLFISGGNERQDLT